MRRPLTEVLASVSARLQSEVILQPIGVEVTRVHGGDGWRVYVTFQRGDYGSVGVLADDLGIGTPKPGLLDTYVAEGAVGDEYWFVRCLNGIPAPAAAR